MQKSRENFFIPPSVLRLSIFKNTETTRLKKYIELYEKWILQLRRTEAAK